MSEGRKTIEGLLSSEIKGDLLILFHRNPCLIDTADGVARRIGRKANAIEKDLAELVELGVLKTKRIGPVEAILFDRGRDKEIQSTIASHLGSMNTSQAVENGAQSREYLNWMRCFTAVS